MTKASERVSPEFTAVKLGRVSRQVVQQFQAQVRSGKLHPGDKLPPERELAVQFGVGRNSIREALRELDLLGIVESRHGEGTFVANPSAEAIMAQAREAGAGIVVMGAYGHSRIREFVMGGATRHALSTMTMPLLVSH